MVEITQYALNQRSPSEGKGKGQKLLAQGIALGNYGRVLLIAIIPRAMPWAKSFWAFSPF